MKPTNASRRNREYLLGEELERLMVAAKANKDGFLATRNHLIILLSYRHGFRVSELINLKWNQIDLPAARIHIKRLKNSNPGVHPMAADECRLLKKLSKQQPIKTTWVFASRTGTPITRDAVTKLLASIARSAKLEIAFHHHMLRHSCGYALASKGCDTRLIQEYLGHKSIQHTVIYTALDASRFEDLWE